MFFIVLGVWLAGVSFSFINHNRKLPWGVFLIGVLVLAGHFTIGFGFITVAIMAILSIVIWIANKLDMS